MKFSHSFNNPVPFTSLLYYIIIIETFLSHINHFAFFLFSLLDALESETEKKRSDALQAIEDLIKMKYNISFEDFKIIETVVHKSEPHKAGMQWKFTGAFYYGIKSHI